MRVTTWAEYGLMVSIHLARRAGEGPVAAREMAEKEQLPADYVEQILLRLRRAGLVNSVRGARGGYMLARPAAEVSVKDVLDASEHGTFEVNCERHPVGASRCAPDASCSIRPVWQLLHRRIDEVLDAIHLSDLMLDESEVRVAIGLEEAAVPV
ncbi:MAG: Rrf2 family transcriptional regulator [Gemmatimonadales bacterium]|nr:Rrf2 family transcriptional regulator [Gemmatimonadales bacterium]